MQIVRDTHKQGGRAAAHPVVRIRLYIIEEHNPCRLHKCKNAFLR